MATPGITRMITRVTAVHMRLAVTVRTTFSAIALGGESGLWTGGRVIKSQQPK